VKIVELPSFDQLWTHSGNSPPSSWEPKSSLKPGSGRLLMSPSSCQHVLKGVAAKILV
jgi:hypothetical protein